MGNSTEITAEKRGLFNRLKRFMRYWLLRLVRIQATPHNIAIGLAAGVFTGLLPVLPLQTVLAIALAFLLGGSKIAAALGTWVSNPLNWAPLYITFYKIGKAVVPFDVPPLRRTDMELSEIFAVGWKFFAAMMTGGLVIAIPSAIVAYFVGRKLVQVYRDRRAERRARSAQQVDAEQSEK